LQREIKGCKTIPVKKPWKVLSLLGRKFVQSPWHRHNLSYLSRQVCPNVIWYCLKHTFSILHTLTKRTDKMLQLNKVQVTITTLVTRVLIVSKLHIFQMPAFSLQSQYATRSRSCTASWKFGCESTSNGKPLTTENVTIV